MLRHKYEFLACSQKTPQVGLDYSDSTAIH